MAVVVCNVADKGTEDNRDELSDARDAIRILIEDVNVLRVRVGDLAGSIHDLTDENEALRARVDALETRRN